MKIQGLENHHSSLVIALPKEWERSLDIRKIDSSESIVHPEDMTESGTIHQVNKE